MKQLTIVSGKGGVGKSSITASLAVLLSRNYRLVAADCDVDASNLAFLLGVKDLENKEKIATNQKAQFDSEKCTSCGKCKDICAFSAIDWNRESDQPEINGYLCEGCGACELVCPEGAFSLEQVENAEIGEAETNYNFPIISGQLKMGESGSGKVVTEVKNRAQEKDGDFLIVDSAAGIGCPVISSVRGSDYVLAVTEPSPSGLSDLKRVLEVVDHFGIEMGIVINKWDINPEISQEIEFFAEEKEIPVLGKLPFDQKFVESLAQLKPVVAEEKEYEDLFSDIISKIPL